MSDDEFLAIAKSKFNRLSIPGDNGLLVAMEQEANVFFLRIFEVDTQYLKEYGEDREARVTSSSAISKSEFDRLCDLCLNVSDGEVILGDEIELDCTSFFIRRKLNGHECCAVNVAPGSSSRQDVILFGNVWSEILQRRSLFGQMYHFLMKTISPAVRGG